MTATIFGRFGKIQVFWSRFGKIQVGGFWKTPKSMIGLA
jgi:hypothetical protein